MVKGRPARRQEWGLASLEQEDARELYQVGTVPTCVPWACLDEGLVEDGRQGEHRALAGFTTDTVAFPLSESL